MSLRQERRKNNATCLEQMVTLTRSALKIQEDNAGAEVGPSGNPTDGLPQDFGARRV